MKSNKEIVYDYVKRYFLASDSHDVDGISTSHVSEKLGMQRSNVSALLNKLTEEGRLLKIKGRPVLYKLASGKSGMEGEISAFKNLIGHKGSLKGAVQLAKAAILYPNGCLNTMIVGEKGSGTSYFVHLMHQFAIENGVLSSENSLIKFNCKHFIDEPDQMMEEVFGPSTSEWENMIEKSKEGILFLDHVEYLPAKGRIQLATILEEGYYTPLGTNQKVPVEHAFIMACDTSHRTASLESLISKTPVRIDLPNLVERDLAERFELINHFFSLESLQVKKQLTINSELLICLLSYEASANVKQLRGDIHIGCASAYVSEYQAEVAEIKVYLSHFKHYVRKGFLRYKNSREKIKELIPQDYSYSYRGYEIQKDVAVEYELQRPALYTYIDSKKKELKYHGVEEEEINQYVGTELETWMNHYTQEVKQQSLDTSQLEKIVDRKIIDLVHDFIEEVSHKLDREYEADIFYGLCLHINGISTRNQTTTVLNREQIEEIMEDKKDEYALALQFASKIEKQLQIKLPMAEVAFLAMFIIEPQKRKADLQKPAVIIAMHGDQAASSIVNVVKELSQTTHIYPFNMGLEKDVDEAYQELKELIVTIHQGKGVILIYDMGSFKTMGKMVHDETGIHIRLLNIPITLIAMDIVRKTMLYDDIDMIYNQAITDVKKMISSENIEIATDVRDEVLITLCATGEGGALQLKRYLEDSPVGSHYKIINVANDEKKTMQEIQKHAQIKATIGTQDPKISGIPFIPIHQIFSTEQNQLLRLIRGNEVRKLDMDALHPVYVYLDEQLHYAPMDKVKEILPKVLIELDEVSENGLTNDQMLGLFVHIACTIDRILAKEPMPKCLQKDWIMTKYETLFSDVLHVIKKLEKKFSIIFSDDEIATIVTIIKQL